MCGYFYADFDRETYMEEWLQELYDDRVFRLKVPYTQSFYAEELNAFWKANQQCRQTLKDASLRTGNHSTVEGTSFPKTLGRLEDACVRLTDNITALESSV